MDEIANPFRPSAGARPPALAGREELLRSFAVTVQRARALKPTKGIIPIGLRGVGKTVLLNRFVSDAEHEDASVGYVEAPESGQFLSAFIAATRQVLLRLDSKHRTSAIIRRALASFASFSYTFPDGSAVSIGVEREPGTADSGHLPRDLTDVLIATGNAAAAHKSCIVLAIDEMQLIPTQYLSALIQSLHRCTQLDLPIVLVGTGLPQLPGRLGDAKTYAERMFTFPELGALSYEATAKAVAEPASDYGVTCTEGALAAIYERSSGYPFFIQEWAHDAWNYAQAATIDEPDVKAVHDVVQTRLDQNFFRVRFDRLTNAERLYLRAMAEFGQTARSGDVAEALAKPVESVGKVRESLIRKGMIFSKEHGVAAFSVPLFDTFMKRTMPFSAPKFRI